MVVKRRIARLPGLIKVRADVVEQVVSVDYDPSLVSEGEIKLACSSEL